jgi:hypothetical protein
MQNTAPHSRRVTTPRPPMALKRAPTTGTERRTEQLATNAVNDRQSPSKRHYIPVSDRCRRPRFYARNPTSTTLHTNLRLVKSPHSSSSLPFVSATPRKCRVRSFKATRPRWRGMEGDAAGDRRRRVARRKTICFLPRIFTESHARLIRNRSPGRSCFRFRSVRDKS